VRCAEIGKKADEKAFVVVEDKKEVEKENSLFAIGAGKTAPAQKVRLESRLSTSRICLADMPSWYDEQRRKSMEPKALAALNSSTNGATGSSNPAREHFHSVSSLCARSYLRSSHLVKASIAASLERARLRSLQFAPKVGSPLAKRVFVMPDMTPDNEEDE